MSASIYDFRPRAILLALLALAMAGTRMSHFGSGTLLPDASLAVFFLGGTLLRRWSYFAGLFLLAFVIDLAVAPGAQETAWCLSPAYWGLLPAYGALWLAGRALAARAGSYPLADSLMLALAGIGAAFLISNLTWYLASGSIDGLGFGAFWLAVARYFPPYAGSALLYLLPAWAAYRIARLRALQAN